MPRPWLCLAAGVALTTSLGSIHAFSVFLEPLERAFAAPRAQVSLLYSVALVALTLAVLVGHRVYRTMAPSRVAAISCFIAAAGSFLAAGAPSLLLTGAGYSLLFGAANGLGYGFSLFAVSHAMPARKGLAMGTVTAFYAVGASLFARVFDHLIGIGGIGLAFSAIGAVLILVGVLANVLLRLSRVRLPQSPVAEGEGSLRPWRRSLVLLWLGYGLGAAAGLMAIGHAAGIAAAASAAAHLVVLGAMVIAVGNALGGFVAGALADRWPVRRLLVLLPLVSAAALLALTLSAGPAAAIAGLGVIGFAYGAVIAVYPVAVAAYVGIDLAAKAYGRVFIAWGLAGLAAPWLAGLLFDARGDYALSLLLAAGAGLLSASVAAILPASR